MFLLYAITGKGSGATASVTISSGGQVSSVSITSNEKGGGYVVGDVVRSYYKYLNKR